MEGTTGVRPRKDMAATDIAHSILKARGQAMHYKELIEQILLQKEIEPDQRGRVIAQIHTEINLDSRFHHKGQGLWALREWSYKGGRVVTVKPERPTPRGRPARLFPEEDASLDAEAQPEDDMDGCYGREPDGLDESGDENDWD